MFLILQQLVQPEYPACYLHAEQGKYQDEEEEEEEKGEDGAHGVEEGDDQVPEG